MKGASVRFEGVTRRYGSVVAIEDLTLEVRGGEFLTLLGPSGSGKTSTLMAVAGFVAPTAGQIFIDDEPVTTIPPYDRNLGVVFQNYALFPHKTVFDNVAFPLRMRKVLRRELDKRVEAALGLVQLGGLERRYPRQLSGGQQQRVALARALVFEPPVLLMDEPLGALDKKLRTEMQLEVKHLQKELEVTVIYVTHDQEEALTMSDRVAVLNQGRLVQVGPPEELYERPANLFVAQFLGESNLLQGVLAEVAGAFVELVSDGGLRVRLSSPQGRKPGDRIRIAFRPERISFAPGKASFVNRFPGIVEEVIYVGEATRYTVRVGGESVTIKQANTSGGHRFMRGDSVFIGWDLGDCLIL